MKNLIFLLLAIVGCYKVASVSGFQNFDELKSLVGENDWDAFVNRADKFADKDKYSEETIAMLELFDSYKKDDTEEFTEGSGDIDDDESSNTDDDESSDTDDDESSDTDESSEGYMMSMDTKEMVVKMYQRVGKMDRNIVKLTKAVEANNKEILEVAYEQIDDSDEGNNRCPHEFKDIGGRCYYFSSKQVEYDEAVRHCNDMRPGTRLIAIETEEERHHLNKFLSKESISSRIWLGANDRKDEGTWKWERSNLPMTFSAWCKDEPNDFKGEHCAVIQPDLCWNDVECCGKGYNFICEYEDS